jgi:hypothetical protein
VVVYEEGGTVKKYRGVGLRVLRYWRPRLLQLVEETWSKRVSCRTMKKGGILLPFGCSFPVCPSSQT